ncbi:hypothetical protein [Maricaulis sp.]|uniref:SDH family Clp fold serine proteinase n=1 Tax=Maricaulis sp. TaxID=1486257 RepID=UPI00260B5716|nr:hypothetical protein [Maricaulis sp.]
MIDFAAQSLTFVQGHMLLILAGLAVVLVLGAAGWFMSHRGPSRTSMIADASRKERERTYRQARRDLQAARDALTKGSDGPKAILVDLICDLGSQWEDRDAPRYISYEQATKSLQEIQPYLEIKKGGWLPWGAGRNLPELIVILHTLGGSSLSSQMIANAIAKYEGPKTAYVPYIAMSGGTKIALACDTIVMGASATLGPIDTQYSGVSKASLDRLSKDPKAGPLPPGVLLTLYEAEKFDSYAVDQAKAVLHKNHGKSVEENPAVKLSSGDWSHSRSIFPEVAKEQLGLNVEIGCRKKVMNYVNARIRMIDTRIESEAHGADKKDDTDPPSPSDLPKVTVTG